nr:hypothetical protein [Nisaea nitritireducens]
MRHDMPDPARVYAGLVNHLSGQFGLGRAARRGYAAGLAVIIDRVGDDRGIDRIIVALRIGQPAQHDCGHRFARHHAVRTLIERPAPTGGREHARLPHADEWARREHEVDPGNDRHVALSGPEAETCLMSRDQRR